MTAKKYLIRALLPEEEIPYHLLLLADETKEAIDKYLTAADIYLLEINHRIIATYVIQIVNVTELEIKNIAVDTDFQGQGWGTILLQHATATAKAAGYKSLLIGTADTATQQLKLYQKEGFERYKVLKDFFIDNYPMPIYENDVQLKDMILLKKML
jgi:aminoglycoside 6'-N-acetyltransferase I